MTTENTTPRADVQSIIDRPTAQVLIIGGGINGIGTFRDLALQGVDVVLVERADYASGASAASSHMIHGGVRYLENGEFRLVRESVQERNRLMKLAPHYVKPLPTTIPIFSTFSGIVSAPLRFLTHKQGKAKERGAALIKLGLTGYDSFSRDGGNVPRHRFVGHKKTMEKFPKRIAFNVIPQIDVFLDDGSTKEEWKMVAETKKMLDPKIKLTATCVRVPVFISHSESVNVEFENPISADEARAILRSAPGVMVIDKRESGGYITPHEAAGEDATYVSRIREDITVENGLAFWCVSDNLRKGAALNAIQIAEAMANRNLLPATKKAA